MKKILLVLLSVLSISLTACKEKENKSTPTPPPTDAATQDDGSYFVYESGGVSVTLGAEADGVLALLGEPSRVFEAPSCAFDGIDKTYYYPGFYFTSYPDGGKDYIYCINLMDDSVQTVEGLYLGMTLEDALAIYGENYSKEQEMYTFSKGKTELAVLVEDNEVVQITYYYLYD